MFDLAERTVGELAVENPAAARVFEKHGIDYCCGGKNSLATVCQDRGLAVAALLRELDASQPEPQERDWKVTPLSDLIGHIVARHHAYLKSELPRITDLFAKVLRAHGEREPRLAEVSDVFEVLKEELDAHMMKEEMILFPAIVRIEAGSNAGVPCSIEHPIARMEYEHESAGRALAQMRHLTLDYYIPEEACNTYRALFAALIEVEADLHQHIHLENNILFPRAITLQTL
ncbi:MAG TPA: iron-sulfur cluster repair di-iron protein [Bryobacteraceae bacterium]|nr:iron-sulfur cluster repair di-iron protein [Bryobacteraceae bacterium]